MTAATEKTKKVVKRTTKKEREQAAEMGKKSFLDGKNAVPYYDKDFQNFLKGRTTKQSIPLLHS